MPNDFAGLTNAELEQARQSHREMLDRIRDAIDNFDKVPLPTNRLARDNLIQSHNKLREATETALVELEELARLRISDV
ncbi:hypothetical protein [Mesorhizobium sp. M0701]|uniref:hypothetical protein n=1 Tax=unclassified Mesorhizobium TaxID=325217 RepID=UPI00333A5E7B